MLHHKRCFCWITFDAFILDCSFLITTFYVVLGGYAIFYLGMALYSLKAINDPVWNHCKNNWNSPQCKELKDLEKMKYNASVFQSSFNLPTAEFWGNFISEGQSLLFGCTLLGVMWEPFPLCMNL